jgi:hypothetical protein
VGGKWESNFKVMEEGGGADGREKKGEGGEEEEEWVVSGRVTLK